MTGPTRVLIVSADMGEGHNATGRALEQAARERWPGVEIRWLDTLDVMGRGVGPLFRRIYVSNVQTTPWLYEFFYRSLCRMRWFANSSKRFVGAWAGRRLARHIREFAPDVILSTYPLGSAGLAWLRRHRAMAVPVGAWVSDFAPHPFWVYDDIDLNLVMHEVATGPASRWVPDAAVAVAAPPVVDTFRPGDRAAARAEFDLPADGFVALVSCGSLGFGSVESAARALVDADPRVHVVVACGRNDALRERVLAGGDAGGRLRALGWTDRMAPLTVASDVVVTNAGGATSLEALACGRAVLMYRPIAAHGRANAELMAHAGLAEVCADEDALAGAVRRLLDEPGRLAALERAALDHAERRRVIDGITELLARAGGRPASATRKLRAEDALFAHVQTEEIPQVAGAVLLQSRKPDGSPVTLADAVDLVDAAPGLHGWIDPGSAWQAPYWVADPEVRTEDVVSEAGPPKSAGPVELDAVMDEFFSAPLTRRGRRYRAGEARLVHGLPDGRSAILIKLHHATADGIAVIGALVGRCRGRQFIEEPTESGTGPAPGWRARLAAAGELARGVLTLARAGRAPRSPLNGRVAGAARHHAALEFPIAELRAASREMRCGTTDLAVGLLAEALHQVLHVDGCGPDTLRVMMPKSTRTTTTYRHAGNRTGAASVDLPVGPMPLRDRIAAARTATGRQVAASAPHAAHAVVRVLGLLPPWLHAVAARLVYRSTWFNIIASVLPGARSPVILHGSCVSTVFPVLSLAPGVRLSVGLMIWADQLTVCVAGDAELGGTVDALGEAFRAAVKEIRST